MRASIMRGDNIILENVSISLAERAGKTGLNGFVYLPSGVEIDPGEFELQLDDGRTETVEVVNVRGGIAMFRGSGEFH